MARNLRYIPIGQQVHFRGLPPCRDNEWLNGSRCGPSDVVHARRHVDVYTRVLFDPVGDGVHTALVIRCSNEHSISPAPGNTFGRATKALDLHRTTITERLGRAKNYTPIRNVNEQGVGGVAGRGITLRSDSYTLRKRISR